MRVACAFGTSPRRNLSSSDVFWTKTKESPNEPARPGGHPVRWTDPGKPGVDFVWQSAAQPALPGQLRGLAGSRALGKAFATGVFGCRGRSKGRPHSGAIAWNNYRQRWVTVFMEAFGKPSAFGELWYAEAASPLGPWGPAVKVLSHENYTFYNPQLHPEFTPADSPILIFEGTYTMQFANHAAPTPRYEYNQILYRLDLDDPALSRLQ